MFGQHVVFGIFESVHMHLLWRRKCSYCWYYECFLILCKYRLFKTSWISRSFGTT